MCQQRETERVRVRIPADLACGGRAKWKRAWIDACIASLVAALQGAGINMRGSCCGHGDGPGHIDLQDGRGLLILSADENRAYVGNTHTSARVAAALAQPDVENRKGKR